MKKFSTQGVNLEGNPQTMKEGHIPGKDDASGYKTPTPMTGKKSQDSMREKGSVGDYKDGGKVIGG